MCCSVYAQKIIRYSVRIARKQLYCVSFLPQTFFFLCQLKPDSRQHITIKVVPSDRHIVPYLVHLFMKQNCLNVYSFFPFFGFFRIGVLVCANKAGPGSRVLQISDCAFKGNQMRVIIRFSKTDQTGKSTTIIFEGKANEKLCPVQGIKQFRIPPCGHVILIKIPF